MALPTRASFFNTGLVPVENTHDACTICLTEPMDSPVQTPCKHTFCKSCVTKWLADSNSCAMCRAPLFINDRAARHNASRMPDPARQRQANDALRASGLASIGRPVGTPFEGAAPRSAIDMFAGYLDRPRMDVLQLQRSSGRALQLVSLNQTPTPVGTVRFQPMILAMDLIAMANLLKHMAAQLGRPYVDNGDPWGQVVSRIWRVISPSFGMQLDALVVPGTIVSALNRQFAFDVDSPLGIFFSDDAAEADLAMLIGMVVESARREYMQDAMQRNLMESMRGMPPPDSSSSGGSSRMRDRLFRRFRSS